MENQFPVEPTAGPLRDLGYLGGVQLTTGPMADRLSNAAETYGGMTADSVLKGFRERAGLPAPGPGLKGWSRETSEPTFGQWVSGLALAGFLSFDQFYILTGGAPNGSTITPVFRIYDTAFVQGNLGYASALSMVLLVLVLIITGLELALLPKKGEA